MVFEANDRRTSCPCYDEFRGPRSDYVRQQKKRLSTPALQHKRKTAPQLVRDRVSVSERIFYQQTVYSRLTQKGFYSPYTVWCVPLTTSRAETPDLRKLKTPIADTTKTGTCCIQ
ncbi:hypothetical protein TNCV_4924171 [Trichonephila clavipes]|nr:hypothetical protein TNCV_4924171 [Trichonephila clavipes]